jgi:hypothetical protein
VILVILALFLLLLALCAVAPWLGGDACEACTEEQRPEPAWYPPIGIR